MRLVTKRLILRDIEDKDAKSLVKHINNIKISKWLLVVPHPYTLRDAKWYINHCKKKKEDKPRKSYSFNIQIKGQEGIVGGIGFHEIDREKKTTTVGYWIGEEYWRQGYVYEAANRLIKFGFNILKLKTIEIGAYATNKPSNNLAKKLGGKFKEQKGPVICKATGKKHMENTYIIKKTEWKK